MPATASLSWLGCARLYPGWRAFGLLYGIMPIRCRFQRSTSTTPATSSPADPGNLELSLRDPDAKGCLDFELVWSLRQKEAVRDVEKEIADRIENPLEEGAPLFQRVFEEFPFLSKRILSNSTGQTKNPSPMREMGFW